MLKHEVLGPAQKKGAQGGDSDTGPRQVTTALGCGLVPVG